MNQTPGVVPVPTLGLDMGGTAVRAGLVHPDGTVRAFARHPLPAGGDARRTALVDLARRYADEVRAVGLAVAGLVEGGRLVMSANVGIGGVDLRRELADATGRPVEVVNDAQAAAVAEVRTGSTPRAGLVLVVTVGTGIGGALVLDGALVRGRGFAGEIGHTVVDRGGLPCGCGAAGCWEGLASGTALARAAREVLTGRDRSVDALVHRAAAGEPEAFAAVLACAEAFAEGLDSVCAVLAPDHVVLGGGVFARGGLVADLYRSVAAGRRWVRGAVLSAATRGDHGGLVGAGLVAHDAVGLPV